MAVDKKAEGREGTEENAIWCFVERIRPEVEKLGCKITTQFPLAYTNFCDRINDQKRGVDYRNGKAYYAIDILVYYELENEEKIPLVAIEGKINSYNTHDVIVYSEKARTHKAVFPHLQYGFIVLRSVDQHFHPMRYYMHSGFDFEEVFPVNEEENARAERTRLFIERLAEQIEEAKRKHKIFFRSALD